MSNLLGALCFLVLVCVQWRIWLLEIVGAGQAAPLCSLVYLELASQELRMGGVPQREAQTILSHQEHGTLDKQNLGEGSEPWFLV